MSSSLLGKRLKENMTNGISTRTETVGDYAGYPMPPAGDWVTDSLSSTHHPWVSRARNSPVEADSSPLHDDIIKFMRYMEPSQREISMRQDLVKRFKNLIASFKINATAHPFGSYVTGLYLPTSDIDMFIKIDDTGSMSRNYFSQKSDLYLILHKIRASGFASKIDDVLSASVPLLRITDKTTCIQIDLTAEEEHSVNSTKAVQKWMEKEGEIIKVLVTVMKIFLSIRNCGRTYTGGVNSYVMIWMVVAWVNLEWRESRADTLTSLPHISSLNSTFDQLQFRSSLAQFTNTEAHSDNTPKDTQSRDYGEALMEFFKFYGCDFDYYTRAIKIEPRPTYKSKIIRYTPYSTMPRYLLSIFDPADETIDTGSKAYGIKHVQASFKEAYDKLLSARSQHNGSSNLLGHILDGNFTRFEEERDRMGRP